MYLAHPKKNGRNWEVAWMWLPHFLAADISLVRFVDQKLSEEFKGRTLEPSVVHAKIISLIAEKYPMGGLKEYLGAVIHVDPGTSL